MKKHLINDIGQALKLLKMLDKNYIENVNDNKYIFEYAKTGELIVSSRNYWNIQIDNLDVDFGTYESVLIIKDYLGPLVQYCCKENDVDLLDRVLKIKEIKDEVDLHYMFDTSYFLCLLNNSYEMIDYLVYTANIRENKRIKFYNAQHTYIESGIYAIKAFENRKLMRQAEKEKKSIDCVITPVASSTKKFKI